MRKILGILILLTLLTACDHKELCLHHPHTMSVRVEYDWKDAPEANPKGMCAYFYPIDGGAGVRYNFSNTQGGVIDLNVGKYRVITYNNDTEATQFYNTDNFCKHWATTREGNVLEPLYGNPIQYAPRSKGTEDEKVMICPDMLWGCNVMEVEIKDDGAYYTCTSMNDNGEPTDSAVVNHEHVITLYPHELTCIYTYEVRNVSNLKHATQISGTLSGMSGMLTLSTEEIGKELVTLPYESYSDGVSKITGKFYTFGHHTENSEPHRMVFYVIMDDGAKYCFKDTENLDVTQQVHNAPNYRRVHLIIDGLELPQPIENGHGFKPSVDDWEVVEEDIIL